MHHKFHVTQKGISHWTDATGPVANLNTLELALDDLPDGRVTIAAEYDIGQDRVAMPTPISALVPRSQVLDTGHESAIWPALITADPPVIICNSAPLVGLSRLEPDYDGVACIVSDQTHWLRISAGEACYGLSDQTRQGRIPSLASKIDTDTLLRAFDITHTRSSRLGVELSTVEAAILHGQIDGASAEMYRLGLAIGAECAASKAYWLGERITVIAAQPMLTAYSLALNHLGCQVLELQYHHTIRSAMT